MSLQVWLPLNGNLIQQGLSTSTVTNNGATVDNNGKIGKCYTFNGTNNYMTIPVKYSDTMTFALWYKPSINSNSISSYHHIFDGRVNESGQEVLCLESPSFKAWGFHVSTNLPQNVWTHICAINNKGVVQIYVNGVLVGTGTTTMNSSYSGDLYIGSRHSKQNFLAESMNDIRIYDHALSPKEVQELAKGLVLHYRLAGPGCPNLLTNTGPNDSGWNINQSGGTFTKTVTNDCTTFNVTARATSWFLYYHTLPASVRNSLKVNTIYTYSFEAKSTANFNLSISLLCGNGTNPMSNSKGVAILGDNQWHKYSVQLTTIADFSTLTDKSQYLYMNGGNVISTTNFRNAKLEEGPIATPWCPNSTDALYTVMGYNNNIEYDCSGYGNNGTIKYPPVWDVNSPRYTTSYKFDGTAYLIIPNPFPSETVVREFSHTAWIKWDSACNTNNGIHSIAYRNLFFRFALGKSNQMWAYGIRCAVDGSGETQTAILQHGTPGSLVNGKWYFIAITFKDGVCKAYLDGEQVASTTSTLVGLKSKTSNGAIGAYMPEGNEPAIGNISDSRFYVTELSAEDIQELYHSAVIVDNSGKTYAYEYFEG